MSAYLIDRQQIAIAIEAVEGTPEVLVAGDVVRPIFEPEWAPSFEMFEQEEAAPSFSAIQQVAGEKSAVIRWATPIKGSGALGVVPPHLSVPLRGCGLGETIDSGVSVTYAPISQSVPSVSIALLEVYTDGTVKVHLVTGARGNVVFEGVKGIPTLARFEMTGRYFKPTEVGVALATPALGPVPPAMLNAAMTFQGAGALKLSACTIDMGNVASLQNDPNQEHGNFSALLSDRRMNGSIDPQQEKIAVIDFFANLEDNVEGVLSYVLGSVPGNIATFTTPKAQITNLTPGDREGIRTEALDLQFNRNTDGGDDEFSLVFT